MIKKICVYFLLILAAFLSLFPFYFMFVSGTNSNQAILAAPPRLIPGSMLAQNFSVLIEKMDIFRVAFNTLFLSAVFVLLAVILFSSAGYVLAKYEFKGKGIIFGFIMVSMMIPAQVMYVPLFQMFVSAGMTNTYASVILPSLANAFGIFLMRQNMVNFPTALIEAARIDGYSEFQIFLNIVLPNVKPALSALVIYMFTTMWNNFMWPLIVLETKICTISRLLWQSLTATRQIRTLRSSCLQHPLQRFRSWLSSWLSRNSSLPELWAEL